VNLAARLQGQSGGGDIVLSAAMACDPAVADLLAPYTPVGETASIKGFERPVAFYRIPVSRLSAPADAGPASAVVVGVGRG